MKNIAFLVAASFFLVACSPRDAAKIKIEDQFPEYIVVEKGTVSGIEKAIIEHSELWKDKGTEKHNVRLYSYGKSFFIVEFEPKLPPYEFLNLIGWLNAPPDIPDVCGTIGRIKSEGTGKNYIFYPEAENEWGDTLIGYTEPGENYRIFLPDAAMSRNTRKINVLSLPLVDPKGFTLEKEFDIYLIKDLSTANPNLEITDPDDHRW